VHFSSPWAEMGRSTIPSSIQLANVYSHSCCRASTRMVIGKYSNLIWILSHTARPFVTLLSRLSRFSLVSFPIIDIIIRHHIVIDLHYARQANPATLFLVDPGTSSVLRFCFFFYLCFIFFLLSRVYYLYFSVSTVTTGPYLLLSYSMFLGPYIFRRLIIPVKQDPHSPNT